MPCRKNEFTSLFATLYIYPVRVIVGQAHMRELGEDMPEVRNWTWGTVSKG